jgi:alpha-L-fucosidase
MFMKSLINGWLSLAVLAPLAAAPDAAAQAALPPKADQAAARLGEEFLSWQFGLFLHFNLGTFVGREWAIGYEDPALFNPAQLDCGQWADSATAAGMKYAVLTVKHTEGYALWDSQDTTHDITAFKNFKGGKGDLVREYVDAFRQRGLKVGFYYCFPGHYSGSGTNSLVPPGKPDLHGLPPEAQGDYVGFIKKQLAELLTQYGPIDLLWIDQYSNPYTGSKWPEIRTHIKSLQPNCVLIANNSLNSKETDIHSYEYPYLKSANPGRALPKVDNQAAAEVCDCIVSCGTWFWQPGSEKHLRRAEDIAAMVRTCNQRRANYLLDVPPDRTGRIPEAYVKRLQEMGQLLQTKPE